MQRWFGLLVAAMMLVSCLEAGYTIRKGKLVDSAEVPRFSAEEHYTLGVKALEAADWDEAAKHFLIVVKNFPAESFYNDSIYYLGVSQYYLQEYDFANETLSKYLQAQSNPRFFVDAIGYKLEIANQFRNGAKKRFFGKKMLPKWAPTGDLAQEIYTEVITALPCHEHAAQALFAKASLYWDELDFRESVDTFQALIRKFPKHELTPLAYLNINRVYLDQAESEFQNPDLLALAQINMRRFERDFPKEERLIEAREDVQKIQELYAQGLFDTGQFYERKGKPTAAIIYYQKTIAQFPDTEFANFSRRRLAIINPEQPLSCAPAS